MKAAFLLAFPVAAIAWAVANHYGVPMTYAQTVVYVLVAKVTTMYLKNDTRVELTVVKAEDNSKKEAEE